MKSSKPETKDEESAESPFLLRLMFTFLHTILTKIETSSERYVVVRRFSFFIFLMNYSHAHLFDNLYIHHTHISSLSLISQ